MRRRWRPAAAALSAVVLLSRLAMAQAAVVPPPADAPASAPGTSAATAAGHQATRWASLADTTFQNWSPEDGLPHPIVTALAQDGAGFIWVGTQDGLARWDGYHFKAYHPDSSAERASGSLSSGFIDTLGVDHAGRLWVGTGDGRVARLDPTTDRFTPVDPPAESGSAVDITALVDDGRQGMWVGTATGLWHVSEVGGGPRAHAQARAVAALAGHAVRTLLQDAKDTLWVGTEQGLWRCTGAAQQFRCAAVPMSVPVSRPAPSAAAAASSPAAEDAPKIAVAALLRSRDGRLWIGTSGAGAFVHDPASGSTLPLRETGVATSRLATDSVVTLAEAPTGQLWLGTNGDGVIVVDPATLATRHVRHDPRLASSLSSDEVYASVVDRSGLLWVGGTRGLSRTDTNGGPFTTIFGETSRENGLSQRDAPTLLAAADGRLWVGLGDTGIDVLDPERGRVDHLEIPRVLDAGSAHHQAATSAVSTLAQAPDGTVYIGTRDGLFETDGQGRGLRHVPWPKRSRVSIQEFTVGGGKLWIGAQREGVWAVDVTAGPGAAPVRPAGLETLRDGRINALRWDAAGARLWVGTPTGLAIFDPAAGSVEHVGSTAGDPASLSGDFVSCILHDSAHRTWIGTLGGGLSLVTGRDAAGRLRFRRIGVHDGLPRPNIGSMQEAADGRIWASTDGGFAVIDPATMKVQALLRADGAAITSYWINSSAKTARDELVYGGGGGITVIRPSMYHPWAFRPPVVVTEVHRQSQAAEAHVSDPRAGLTLQPGENAFSVEFAALDFSAPERNRYAYRLDGVDDAWISTDAAKRLAAYTNLPPGDYTLQLRGSNRNGEWSEMGNALSVHVLPLWYQTWWARGAAGLLALALLNAVIRYRTRALELRKRELQAIVAERTAALEEKQRELMRANENLALLASFDPLTRCLNRRAFLEQGEQRFFDAAAQGANVFCAMIDIDHFKNVNDRHGHPVGDAVIRSVAVALQRSLRTGDLVCRYGGEEFCVLLVGIEESIACMLAERIRAKVEHEAGQGVREVPGLQVTVSIGLAARTAQTPTLDPLIARADEALYAAKHGGRNRVAMGPDGRVISGGPLPPQHAAGDNGAA
jgi:diguanylate cyclase (GGDEF)-like protein